MQSSCGKSGGSKNMELLQLLKPLELLKLSVDIRKFHKFQNFQYFHKLLNIYILTTPPSIQSLMAWKSKDRLETKKYWDCFLSKSTTNLSQMSN